MTGGGGACQGKEVKGVKAGSSSGGLKSATAEGVTAVAVPYPARNDVMAKVEEMMKKLKMESLSLYGEFIAEWATHVGGLMDSIRLKQDRKKAAENWRKKRGCWLHKRLSEKYRGD